PCALRLAQTQHTVLACTISESIHHRLDLCEPNEIYAGIPASLTPQGLFCISLSWLPKFSQTVFSPPPLCKQFGSLRFCRNHRFRLRPRKAGLFRHRPSLPST